MIYGYARVSSKGQASEGTSLRTQGEKLRAHGAQQVYEEVFTGTVKERPAFNRLLSVIKSGDTLMVTTLDRFARTTVEGYEMMEDLIRRGVTVHILNLGVMDNTPMSKLLRNFFLAMAQFERDTIVDRLAEGREAAKQDPEWREGRPHHESYERFVEQYKAWERGEVKLREALDTLGIGRTTWYRWRDEYLAETS